MEIVMVKPLVKIEEEKRRRSNTYTDEQNIAAHNR